MQTRGEARVGVEKPNLDLMRSFAVVAVLLDHTCQAIGIWERPRLSVVPLGVFAVYLFFVHTTLVLMWSLERQPGTLNFYVRRAFRIYPLAIVVVLSVVLLNLPVCGSPHRPFVHPSHDWRVVCSNLLLIQNLVHHPVVESVLWSLPIEVQMYIGLPALFAFATRGCERWPIVTLWATAALLTLSFMPLPRATPFEPTNFFGFVPNFLPGVVAFVGWRRRAASWPAWGFAVLVAALAFLYMAAPSRPMGWSCCLALGLLLPNFRQTRRRALRVVGHVLAKYSYGIYLLHMVSIAIGFYYLHLNTVVAKVTVELTTLAVLAPAAYHLIEAPMIRYGAKLAGAATNSAPLEGPEVAVP